MLLLMPGLAQLRAGTSGDNIGYGDGQSLLGSPSASFGTLPAQPAFVVNGSSDMPYLFYNSSGGHIDMLLKPGISFTTLTIGNTDYAYSASTVTSYSGHQRLRWTSGVTALVDGATYAVTLV